MGLLDSQSAYLLLKATSAGLTSGIGGLPLLFYNDLSPAVKAASLVIAAGMMSGCSFGLLLEAYQVGDQFLSLALWGLFGAGIIHVISSYIESIEGLQIENLRGHAANRAAILIVSMAIHSVAEGMSVGVAAKAEFQKQLDWLVVWSLAAHNIPEGLAISLVLRHQGMDVLTSCMYAVIANIPQPIAALFVHNFVTVSPEWLSIGFAISAGTMLLIVVMELLPEAVEAAQPTHKLRLTLLFLVSIAVVGFLACHDDHSDELGPLETMGKVLHDEF